MSKATNMFGIRVQRIYFMFHSRLFARDKVEGPVHGQSHAIRTLCFFLQTAWICIHAFDLSKSVLPRNIYRVYVVKIGLEHNLSFYTRREILTKAPTHECASCNAPSALLESVMASSEMNRLGLILFVSLKKKEFCQISNTQTC